MSQSWNCCKWIEGNVVRLLLFTLEQANIRLLVADTSELEERKDGSARLTERVKVKLHSRHILANQIIYSRKECSTNIYLFGITS